MVSIGDHCSMLPFTADQFFDVFAAYNLGTWPSAPLAYVMGGVALAQALRGGRWAGQTIAALLAVLWAWNGVVYHGIYFAAINPAARIFAAGFLAQAALLLWFGVWRGALDFGKLRPSRDGATGIVLILYASVVYPLLGAALGHAWPAAPVFGSTPCPLTIFTCGLLLLARDRVPLTLMVLPALWSLIGGSAAMLLDVPPDWMLPVAGLLTLVLLAMRPRGTPVSQGA
jgi:hypothetical protein